MHSLRNSSIPSLHQLLNSPVRSVLPALIKYLTHLFPHMATHSDSLIHTLTHPVLRFPEVSSVLSLLLSNGDDQDESGLGPALKVPRSDGRTDPYIDVQGCAESGESKRVLFEFSGPGKDFQGREPPSPDSSHLLDCLIKASFLIDE